MVPIHTNPLWSSKIVLINKFSGDDLLLSIASNFLITCILSPSNEALKRPASVPIQKISLIFFRVVMFLFDKDTKFVRAFIFIDLVFEASSKVNLSSPSVVARSNEVSSKK